MAIIRELTFVDRTLWGFCPICEAGHGVPCDRNAGRVVGLAEKDAPGAHLGRLSRAPYTVIVNATREEESG